MRIVNPATPYGDIPAENIFIALNSSGQQVGQGFMTIKYNPKFSATLPLNIYFKIDAADNVRSQLYGALMARANQYCMYEQPNLSARIYTDIDPNNTEALQFYTYCGLENNDRDEIIQIRSPQATTHNLYGCEIREIVLQSQSDFGALANRLNDYRLTPLTEETLIKCSEAQHFLAINMVYNNLVIGELVFYGSGTKATLIALHVDIAYRRNGVATSLLRQAIISLQARGVREFYAILQRRSMSQRHLAKACKYKAIKTTMLYPGISIMRPSAVQGFA